MLRRRGIELACVALGVTVLAVTVWTIGVETLVRDLRVLGWGLAAVLLVEGLNVLLNTGGWALAFPGGARPVSAARLVAVRLAGDAVNYLTPSATIGGELLRVRLLAPHVPSSVRWASVSAAKVGQSLAQAAFILLGIALGLPGLAAEHGWLGGRPAVAIASVAAAAAIVTWAGFVRAVGHGFWTALAGGLGRIRLGWLLPESWGAPGRDLDAMLARVGAWRASAALGCFVAGWAVGALEIYLILHWVGHPVSWRTALALEVGSVLIDGILFFIPAKIGTQEGGKVVLFAALGLTPARGLTVGVVRRIRELTYAGLGLAALGWMTARPNAVPAGLDPASPRGSHRA
jgi:lysylphosphatidylglycerol synthase-like protein